MSNYWGYVCLTHQPPLYSKLWINRGGETLTQFLNAWKANGYNTETRDLPRVRVDRGWDDDPAEWLLQHLNCRVGVASENGAILDENGNEIPDENNPPHVDRATATEIIARALTAWADDSPNYMQGAARLAGQEILDAIGWHE